MITERKSDIEIRYIFIKKFTYLDSFEREKLCGHPHKGRIYRSVFNLHTKHHRLLLPDGVILGVDTLVGNQAGADFELIEVTIDNILDLEIREEDLEIFLKEDTDLFQNNIMVEVERNLQQALIQNAEEENEASDRASHTIMSLFQISPTKFEVILELAERLIESDLTAHEDITTWMRYHPNHGLALNTAKAFKALDRYSADDRKTSEDPEDLYEALEAIIVELERVQE